MNTKKLTTKEGKDIFVNIELATSIKRSGSSNVTVISFSKDYYVIVTETPEEIFQLPSVYNAQ